MTRQELPSPELLRKLLRYEPETGKLFWKKRTPDMFRDGRSTEKQDCAIWNRRYAQKEAFTASTALGYRVGRIKRRNFYAHRVIWAIQYGAWPEHQIDHINGVVDDNRIDNLRAVTSRDNGRNKRRTSRNTSGVTGVSWCKQTGKWRAEINTNIGPKNLGRFVKKSGAISARKAAEIEWGYHQNHGRANA